MKDLERLSSGHRNVRLRDDIGYLAPFQVWAIILCGNTKHLLTAVANRKCSDNETNALDLLSQDPNLDLFKHTHRFRSISFINYC